MDKTFEKETAPAGKGCLPGIVHFCELQRKASAFFPADHKRKQRLFSWYPHPLDREVEVPPVLCPKSLPLFALSIITTMNFVRICGQMLTESVQNEGILSPLIVRPLEGTDGYEVISGHRRLHAAQRAGLSEVPALVYEISREEAAIMLVDSNLHREHILPSEKAFAYKLKMEALKHRGITCGQVGHKSRDTMSEDESGRQVQRYIRLTYLIPELLQLVDDGKIALTPAVELSYLSEKAQTCLLEEMRRNDCTPSLSQAIRMKKLYQTGSLSPEDISTIMQEEKANQQEKVSFKTGDLRKFFPKSYSAAQMQETILKLLSEYQRKRQRAAER